MTYLKIDSTQRQTGSASDYTLVLPRAIEKGQTFELSHAHIPQTQYNITSKNNAFYFQEQDTGTHLITLDPGHYSPTSLVESLKAKMNAVVSNPVTITISSTTFKITISSAGNFRVLMAVLTTPCKPLGFNTDTPYGLSHTADRFLDLEVESSLSIDINDMFGFDALDHGATFNLPIDVDVLQVLDYTPPVHFVQTITFNQPAKTLRVRLKDSNNETVDLNGAEWYFVLKRIV